MSFKRIERSADAIAFISEFADGTTEFLDNRFRRGGRDGVSPLGVDALTGYSSRFHPKNSLILPIAFLLLNEGVNHDLWEQFIAQQLIR